MKGKYRLVLRVDGDVFQAQLKEGGAIMAFMMILHKSMQRQKKIAAGLMIAGTLKNCSPYK